jgi:predicted ribosome quality control (RQC) complex YloA/Tae2 family protein
MPVQPVDFVDEVGAYKQRIEKELRSLRPKNIYYPSVGPYAIPDKLPPDMQCLVEAELAASRSSTANSAGRQGRRFKDEPETAARLRMLEEQILEEREGRKHVEEQIDRLQSLLQKLVDKEVLTKR